MSKFLHDHDNDDARAIAVPRVFSENSRAKTDKKVDGSSSHRVI